MLCMLVVVGCNRHAEQSALVCYEEGKALRESGKPIEAMQVFLRAAHSGTHDEALLGRVYSNMANMCRQANEHSTAYEVYCLSAEHFASSGDSLAYAYALNNMAWELAVQGEKARALELVEQALSVQLSAADFCLVEEKVRESRAAACLFAQEYDSVLVHTTPPTNDYLLMVRAQAYSYLQIDDSATYYARLLLPRVTNPFYLDDIYYILTHNDANIHSDSLRALSSARADVQKVIKERHGQLTQAVQLLEEDMRRNGKLWSSPWIKWLLCIIGALFVYILIVVWRRRHTQTIQTERQHEALTHCIALLRESKNLREELAWNDYTQFCLQTNKLFNGLASRLHTMGLNEQDIRLCVLVLLGLSHKEIADMLNCSHKSIGKFKDLTAKKLGISGGQLQEILNSKLL